MRTEHETDETTQHRAQSLSVSSGNYDATEDDDNERTCCSLVTCSNQWCRSFSTAFQLSTVNVCCIFAALHLNGLLKRLLDFSKETDDEWLILGGFVGLFYAGYYLTTVLTFQLRKSPNVVWVFALLGGHVMGLALKQVYVSVILLLTHGTSTTSLVTAFLVSVPILVGFSCAHLVLVYAFHFAVVQVRIVCGRRAVAVADGAAASKRWRAAYAEAVNDAYSISLGYILFASLWGISYLLVDAERSQPVDDGGGLFYKIVDTEEVPCYVPGNQSIATWNRSHGTIDQASNIFVLLFSSVLLFLFPCAAFHLQQRGSRLFEHLHVARQGPAALRYAKHMCATQMKTMGKALQFCLGWSLYHILSSVIKRERLEHVESTDSSILLQIFLYTVGFWLCALLLETLKCRPRHQHQRCVNSQRCVKYFTKQVLPAWAVMWATYIALNFEAFFECAESGRDSTIQTILFSILAAVIFTAAAHFFGRTYSLEFEKELKETMEDVERCDVVAEEGEVQLLHSDS